MRLLRRRTGRSGGTATATADLAAGEAMRTLDDLRDEIAGLTQTLRKQRDPERERQLLRARHLAGIGLVDTPPSDPRFAPPDTQSLPEGHPLPELAAGDLTPELLRAGILRDGCVLVRELVPRADALHFASQIDRAYSERDRREAGEPLSDGYYEEFAAHPRFEQPGRLWVQAGGGLLAVDSPALCFEMFEMFEAAGLPRLISEYLGEPVLVSVQKTTLRKAEPAVPGGWHQDGFFMGPVRALNLWLSLSRCGDEAPGLDIVPRRLESYVATGTEGAKLQWTISEEVISEVSTDTGVIRPIFEPGDALFFDELFLHKTGSDPSMPKPRFAIESWFFGGSGSPPQYAPIAV